MPVFERVAEGIVAYDEDRKVVARLVFSETEGKTVTILSTFVDDSLRGQGIAGRLMQEAVEYLRETDRRAIPQCSYAVAWFEKHPEHQNVLAK